MVIFSKIILTRANAKLLNSLETEIFNPGLIDGNEKKILTQLLYKNLCTLAVSYRGDS